MKRGFTLIELLVVVAIVGILISITIKFFISSNEERMKKQMQNSELPSDYCERFKC